MDGTGESGGGEVYDEIGRGEYMRELSFDISRIGALPVENCTIANSHFMFIPVRKAIQLRSFSSD